MPSTIEAMREQFLAAISDFSEDRWAAGWMEGIEHEVRQEGGAFLVMAGLCGGWPIGYRAAGGWSPLTDDEVDAFRSMMSELQAGASVEG